MSSSLHLTRLALLFMPEAIDRGHLNLRLLFDFIQFKVCVLSLNIPLLLVYYCDNTHHSSIQFLRLLFPHASQ